MKKFFGKILALSMSMMLVLSLTACSSSNEGSGDKKEGSGIGLSIVKSIIDLHEGHISVESQIGVGSTFKIILPQIGDNADECNIFDINDYNTELELSDIYEVLV